MWHFIRFPSVDIPKDAVLTNAYIRWRWANNETAISDSRIYIEDADDPAAISGYADGNSRSKSDTSIDVQTASVDNTYYNTPSFHTALTTHLSRAGWVSGQSIQFIIGPSVAPLGDQWGIDQAHVTAIELHVTYA